MTQEAERETYGTVASEGGGRTPLLDAGAARTLAILVATAFGLYLCYRLALPFLAALTWAVVLAIVLAPLHRRLQSRIRNTNLAALVLAAAAAIIALTLLILVAQQLLREVASGAAYLENTVRTTDLPEIVGNHPRLLAAIAWIERQFDPAEAISSLAQWLTQQSTSLLRGSINQAISFVLTFYLFFYFLRDRERAVRQMMAFSPLRPSETIHVAARFVDTVHATIFGTVAVAAVQGTLGGLMFWWLGLPTPIFWGLVMGLLAIVPVLGAFVIWVPAAIFLALEGEWTSALMLAVWGGVIIATIDNLLYPLLVGNRLRLHTAVAFIGAVGGIIYFGAAGLVLGPAAIAVTMALVEILKERFGTETAHTLQENGYPGAE